MLLLKKPQILTFFLVILTIFLIFILVKEKKQNEPYKREAEIISNIILRSKNEENTIETERKKLIHPLSIEKERKEKFGENLDGERVIFVSEEVLNNIILFKR